MGDFNIVAVAGGSCSGKTTLVSKISKVLGPSDCTIVQQDNYYLDRRHEDPKTINFDHPDSIDFKLLKTHLRQLKSGRTVAMPAYDFHSHSRLQDTITVTPKKIIFVEGILILTDKSLIDIYDHSVFIECDRDTRWQRRMARDIKHRGRTEESINTQFFNQVEPMHRQFVEPSKEYSCQIFNQAKCLAEIAQQSSDLLNVCKNLIDRVEQA